MLTETKSTDLMTHGEPMSEPQPTFRVVAININTHERRVIETGKTERNADAIVAMAVMRRGTDVEFYITEPER